MLDLEFKSLTDFAPNEQLITDDKRIQVFSVGSKQEQPCPRDRDNDVVLYVARGSGELFIDSYQDNDETVVLKAEMVVVIPSNIQFSLRNTSTETLMVLMVS